MAMAVYTVGLQPLIHKLKVDVTQVQYANDASVRMVDRLQSTDWVSPQPLERRAILNLKYVRTLT